MIKRPILILFLAYLCGVGVYFFLPWETAQLWYLYAVALLFVLWIAITLSRTTSLSLILFCLLFLICGLLRTSVFYAEKPHDIRQVFEYYRGRVVRLHGTIHSQVRHKNPPPSYRTLFTLKLKEIEDEASALTQKVSGRVLVHVFKTIDLMPGDEISIEGKLHWPMNYGNEDRFSYRRYLNRRGIHYIFSVGRNREITRGERDRHKAILLFMHQMRKQAEYILDEFLTPNESGVLKAMVLGVRDAVPPHIRDVFEKSGVAHVLAISGLHMGIIVIVVLTMIKLLPVSYRLQVVLCMSIVLFYIVFVGARPSVVRAGIMAMMYLSSLLVNRKGDALTFLTFSAWLLVLVQPYIIFDIGFQLSYACVLSIYFLYPATNKLFSFLSDPFPKIFRRISSSMALSTSIFIGVAPIISYYFQIISPISIISNILIVPCLAMLIILTFFFYFFAAMIPSWSIFPYLCIKLILNLMIAWVYLLIKIPGAYVYLN